MGAAEWAGTGGARIGEQAEVAHAVLFLGAKRVEGLELGADDYLSKPIRTRELREALSRCEASCHLRSLAD